MLGVSLVYVLFFFLLHSFIHLFKILGEGETRRTILMLAMGI